MSEQTKNYFLINQCANGWIVRKNDWGMISDAQMSKTFVFNSMSDVAIYICDDVGAPLRGHTKPKPNKRAGGAVAKRKKHSATPKRNAKGHFISTGNKGAKK